MSLNRQLQFLKENNAKEKYVYGCPLRLFKSFFFFFVTIHRNVKKTHTRILLYSYVDYFILPSPDQIQLLRTKSAV